MTWLFKYLAAPVLLLVWLRSACYVVDYGEFAYVTRFGERVTTRDGGTEAGLYLKMPWPVDSVLRVDRRLQSFDLPAVEVLTRNPDPNSQAIDKTLTVDAFVTWRIPDAVAADQFIRSVGTPEQVKRILAPQFPYQHVVEDLVEHVVGIGDTHRGLQHEVADAQCRIGAGQAGKEGVSGVLPAGSTRLAG